MVLILVVGSLSGCGAKPEKPAPKEKESKIPEVPEILTEKEMTILSTMHTIDGIKGVEKAKEKMEQEKKKISEESEVDQKKEEKDQAAQKNINLKMLIEEEAMIIPVLKEEKVEDEIIKPEAPPSDPEEVWHKVEENVTKLHRQWNVLETNLQDVKVSQTKAEEYEKLMDEATKNISDKKIEESLMSLNELTNYLAEFRNYFKSKVPYEIYKLKYLTRKIALLASAEDYEAALEETKKLEEVAKGLRQKIIEKDGEKVISKYELSLQDLQHELKAENQQIAQIKSAIVMKNIELMIPLFESGQ